MSAEVKLTVIERNHPTRTLTFRNRIMGSIGRSRSCYIQLPNDEEHLVVSRQHCLLEIDPPQVRVQDLGSRNGTFVNDVNIGQRSHRMMADDTIAEEAPFIELEEGDQLRIGNTILRVSIDSAAEPLGTRQSRQMLLPGECHRTGEFELMGSPACGI